MSLVPMYNDLDVTPVKKKASNVDVKSFSKVKKVTIDNSVVWIPNPDYVNSLEREIISLRQELIMLRQTVNGLNQHVLTLDKSINNARGNNFERK